MDKSVRDKKVVITGGAQGLGFSIADKFLENEAKVVLILDLEEDTGNIAAKDLNAKYGEGKAVFIKCDVTKDLDKVFDEIIRAYSSIDILVNNAGGVKEDSIRDTLNLNALSVIEWSMKFLEHMRIDEGGNGGAILNMSSMYGYCIEPYAPFYTASKHAVLGFTKSKGHADTYAKTGVRMIALCPGFTRTRLARLGPKSVKDVAFVKYMEQIPWQDAEVVGQAAVDIYRTAESGTGWIINDGKVSEHWSKYD